MTMEIAELSLSIFQLAEKLASGEKVVLDSEESLIITGISTSDFIQIVNEENLEKKLAVLQQVFNRLHLHLFMEGDVLLGALNLDDKSWKIASGKGKTLAISGRSLPVNLGIEELVNFLKKLPINQGLVFSTNQDLILSGFNEQACINYYDISKSTKNPKILEKTQDQFFIESSETLKNEKLCLKIAGIDAETLNRDVSPTFGQIIFRANSSKDSQKPKLLLALVKQE